MDPRVEAQVQLVTKAIGFGRLVPFLGAGANLLGRKPEEQPFGPGLGEILPSGAELSRYLAQEFQYPLTDTADLARVSQYAALMSGMGMVYDELRELFDQDFPNNGLHLLLAGIPALLAGKGYLTGTSEMSSGLLVVTTNYDDVLERTFAALKQPFDLIWYIADGDHRGRFWHRPPDGPDQLVERPNEYGSDLLKSRPVILKIHGSVDRRHDERDSFVITEDHYIEYLTRTDISELLPAKVSAKLSTSHFLFMGYGMRDWNLRVILHRLWGEQQLSRKSWAIQLNPNELDRRFWQSRGVEILDLDLAQYVTMLQERLERLPVREG